MGEVEGSGEGAGEDQARSGSGGAGAWDGVAALGGKGEGKGEKWREGREREERRQESGRLVVSSSRRLFAFRIGSNAKCVLGLGYLLEYVFATQNTMRNLFLGLGNFVGVSLIAIACGF